MLNEFIPLCMILFIAIGWCLTIFRHFEIPQLKKQWHHIFIFPPSFFFQRPTDKFAKYYNALYNLDTIMCWRYHTLHINQLVIVISPGCKKERGKKISEKNANFFIKTWIEMKRNIAIFLEKIDIETFRFLLRNSINDKRFSWIKSLAGDSWLIRDRLKLNLYSLLKPFHN